MGTRKAMREWEPGLDGGQDKLVSGKTSVLNLISTAGSYTMPKNNLRRTYASTLPYIAKEN